MSSTMAPNVRGVGAWGRCRVYSMCGMRSVRCPIEVTVENGKVTWLQCNREKGRRPFLGRHTRLIVAFAVGVGCLIAASCAVAVEAASDQVLTRRIPVAQIFTFLFLMLGPFKIIGPFAKITKGEDAAFTHRIALLSTLFSILALLVAAFLGETFLSSYGIPLPVLALSAGLVLFLVALISILQQFLPTAAHGEAAAGHDATPALKLALTPMAFPTIVTPHGIAMLVVFLALSPDQQSRLAIGAILLAIMLLNLIVMIMTRHILPVLSVVLPILGAVLGVVQVALGLQIMNSSLKALGVT